MLLLRTICVTDHKGRPHHNVKLIATATTRKELIRAQATDIYLWIAADLARDRELDEGPKKGTELDRQLAHEELIDCIIGEHDPYEDPTSLKAEWTHEDRFEMRQEKDQDHREFVERMDQDFITTVYHILKNDHEYTDRK